MTLPNLETNSLSAAENDPASKLPTITELFRQQVERRENNPAIVWENQSINYLELDGLSNQVANTLLAIELPAESCVGVCLDRSHHAIVSMLGIMKAGLAFVPLDPDFPSARLEYMIADASIDCCITEPAYLSLISPLVSTTFLAASSFNSSSITYPDATPSTNQLAYVMYTSGSTGNPKGVQIEHGALSNYALADAQAYKLTDEDCTLQFSTLNFDIAIEEIFPPLITGSRIAVRPQRRSDELNELSALIRQYEVTAIHVATAYWHEWVNMLVATKEPTPQSIRLMVVTGEKVSSEHYRQWQSMTDHSVMWANAYGPTETTVTATVFIPTPDWNGTSLPIGKPLKGYTAHIVDAELKPVLGDATGELYIGGPSLARGYLNRPDLTEAVFVTAPSGERLYRTGDLARWLESGDIEYAGRVDHQIKIGSFRIEPGEIEEALNRHPNILESLVIASDAETSGGRQIIAYAASREGVSASEIHSFLKAELPIYMLPAAYVLLEQLPKTLNGKIDRDALPDTSTAENPIETEFVAPSTDIECKLADIWSDVLGRSNLSVNDDFFAVGGSSLKVASTITRMHQILGKSLSARQFYANPTIVNMSALLTQQLPAGKVEIKSGASGNAAVELTDNQYQIWFQQKLFPELTIYNIYEAASIEGNLDVSVLQSVIAETLKRHRILDVKLEEKDGRCFQSVPQMSTSTSPIESAVALRVNDDQSETVEKWIEKQIHQPFDLSSSQLFRFSLLKQGDENFVLVLTVHHIISDGWSMTLLIRDIGNLYNHRCSPARYLKPIPPKAFSYVDVVAFTHERKTTKEHDAQLNYWLQQLADVRPIQLPQINKGPVNREYSADEVQFSIDIPRDKLDAVCNDYAISPFMLLLGAFKCVLYRYTNEESISVAIAHSGRAVSGVENTFGQFVNTLVAKTKIEANANVAQFLTQVRKTSLDAFANQDISLSELVSALNPDRTDGAVPFTRFLFLMQDIPDTQLVLDGLKTVPIVAPACNIDYDILLEMTEQTADPNHPYTARLVFADELYHKDDMQRTAEHIQNLLHGLVDQPQTAIRSLSMLSDTEKTYLRDTVNQTNQPYPVEGSLIEEISKVAVTVPEKTAVSFESSSFTYAQLLGRVKLLAGHLCGLGVQPNTLVAVFMDRSDDMLVALLAIQYAGAAYLPMDPLYPEERIAYIMQDANAPVLITQSSFVPALPDVQATIIQIDNDWGVIKKSRPLDRLIQAKASDLAYVIYTSGSTGKPKGVQLTRKNVLNFLYSMRTRPGFNNADTLTAVTTISFDIAVLELYLPLISGGTVDIVSRETAIDGAALAARIEQKKSTVLQATPATWRLLLDAGWQPDRPFKALVGGEALPTDIIDPLLRRVDELWNMYGPTETTVWSTCARINHSSASPSIGTPIGNTAIYILADNGEFSPIGIPGELCIGGDGVALGYTNQPELTAEKFIATPWSSGNRIYRTGDSARWMSDGSLDFLGRLDNQIKLRGYRIEPGEIEKCLCTIAGIEQAVVIVNNDQRGDFLTAYLVCSEEVSQSQIREQLMFELPDYMIPTAWVTIEALPLTPNGKIDRKSLPNPKPLNTTSAHTNPPSSETEKALAAIWSDLLGIDSPGRDDNFFSLGGHSLMAMRFIAKAEKDFGVALPVRSLMGETLSKIALRVNPYDSQKPNTERLVAIDYALPSNIGEAENYLYGMLHAPRPGSILPSHNTDRSRAILICQPIGNEYLRLHKSLQRLSCELARQGHCVLRFDYFGTGDSPGYFYEARLERWKQDIVRAASHLRTKTGASEITLIGARIGATVMLAAGLENVRQTILWDPVNHGEKWIQEQQRIHQYEMKNLDRYRWVQRVSDKNELVGYQYSNELIKDLIHLEQGSNANSLQKDTVIINSAKHDSRDSVFDQSHKHSLEPNNYVYQDDGQRWADPASVNDMVLGLGAIRTIMGRLI